MSCSALALALAALVPQDVVLDELLVVERTSSPRRSAVVVDAVEARVVRGTLEQPREGGRIERPGAEPLVWRRIEAGEGGQFQDPALSGGWAYATVSREAAGVMLLEARGHRRVYVNGVPRGGDVYDLGITRLPVALEAGTNRFLFRGGRGRLRAELTEPPSGVYLEERDRVLPDVIRGEDELLHLGIRVGNATTSWVRHASLGTGDAVLVLPDLAPLSVLQVAVPLVPPGELDSLVDGELAVRLHLMTPGEGLVAQDDVTLAVKDAVEKHRRTFVSDVDGSVQYYAVTPPSGESDEPPALFLSLHGASVQATNQAYSYQHKEWGVVVAPTNRRPFGFDWEDWGRYDALEVFELARARWGTNPRRQYLTGHSMGGHGTWNLGVHLPGTFAAIAPSAGWRDFWSYAADRDEDPDPVMELMDDAANASRTLLLEQNLLHAGVYVLHGDRDDNVPVEQARFMRARLAAFHPNFAYYERPGAGHWWGNECMDWPPLFRFLRDNVLPAPEDVREVAFVTVNPAINATCHWVTIQAQEQSLLPSRVDARLDLEERRLTATTENVAFLTFDLSPLGEPVEGQSALAVELDGAALPDEQPAAAVLHFERRDGAWRRTLQPGHRSKGPRRAGPFKDAFRNDMVLVYGTQGGTDRTTLLLQRARLDAEVFGYRGNGALRIVSDVEYNPRVHGNPILFGNADDNALCRELFAGSPVRVVDGAITVGGRTVEGDDLVALFARPVPGTAERMFAAVSATGDAGVRLSAVLPYFVSGVGYPDWTVVGPELLERGAEGVRAAGFFGPDWGLDTGRAAWR